MATSKILHMKDCGTSFHGKHLKSAIQYIAVPDKTQNMRLVAGVNCQAEYAFEQMRETKEKFGKVTGRQGYHLIISFVGDEVDADTAFELVGKFVQEYLGKEYEVVYAVHDNTDHIHAHIIFNSVSFLTGKKYHYQKGDWAKEIQPITNRLCAEYGLSTIEIENEKKSNDRYKEWNVYRDGPFVWADMIKRDIDIAIVQSENYEEFIAKLINLGYEVKQGKYVAVKPPGLSRFKRLKSLGEDYSEERIRERIPVESLKNYKTETLDEAERIVYSKIPRGKRVKLTAIQKQYYARLYRIGLLKRRPYSEAWKYKDDIRRMEKLQEEYIFLLKHDVESYDDLVIVRDSLTDKKKEISAEKSRVYRSRKKCEELFSIAKEMGEYKEAEDAFLSGDMEFQEEHDKWIQLSGVLEAQGYTYDEIRDLQDYYRGEIARVRGLEADASKEVRIAERILNEMAEDARNKLEEKIEDNNLEKQPIR